jgi:hypothetical protein
MWSYKSWKFSINLLSLQILKSTTNCGMCAKWHCHLLLWPLCHRQITHFYICSFNCCGHSYSNTIHRYTTLKQHGQADLQFCLQTSIEHMYMRFNFLPLLHFPLQFPKIYTFLSLVIPFLCTTPSSVLGFHVTPLPMFSTLTSTTHCL